MLKAEWLWPAGRVPKVRVGNGRLTMMAPEHAPQAFVARSLLTETYTATVGVLPEGLAGAGLGLIGDAQDDVVLSREGDGLKLWRSDKSGKKMLWQKPIRSGKTIWLRAESTEKGEARFSYRVADGEWSPAGASIGLKELLPWDSGLRVGLVVDGKAGASASFVRFSVQGGAEKP